MRFRLNTIPAGIPTWFIARSHRFSTHNHWRNGALFAYGDGQKHLALAQAFPHSRYLQLTVRGPNPRNFFSLLRDGIEVTLDRFPGLRIGRMMPCPGHGGEPCTHEFDYANLQQALLKKVESLQCPVSYEMVSVSGLLFGIHQHTQPAVLDRIDVLTEGISPEEDTLMTATGREIKHLREWLSREFARMHRREQSEIDSYCPNVFVLRPRETKRWREKLVGHKAHLQLYCQYPEFWHPALEGGCYEIDISADWLQATGPYIGKMVGFLKRGAPVAKALIAVKFPAYAAAFKNDLDFMAELVKLLPGVNESREGKLVEMIGESYEPERFEGAALRAIRFLLDELDHYQHWGDLRRVLTPEGHYLWLCKDHAEEYRPWEKENHGDTEARRGMG